MKIFEQQFSNIPFIVTKKKKKTKTKNTKFQGQNENNHGNHCLIILITHEVGVDNECLFLNLKLIHRKIRRLKMSKKNSKLEEEVILEIWTLDL